MIQLPLIPKAAFAFTVFSLAAHTVNALTINDVWINEFHYDNISTDSGEFIEVAGKSGTDLSALSIALYNGANGLVYDTEPFSGITLTNQINGFGFYTATYPVNGIQNGSPDGIALVWNSTVLQFLSYEGVLTAADGPANGQTSVDIGVSESSSTPVGSSLQLTGSGSNYSDFTWSSPGPSTASIANTGQSFTKAIPDSGSTAILFVATMLSLAGFRIRFSSLKD